MSAVSCNQDVHRELARQINEEALRDPRSPYAGKYVGIANGQVAVIADDLDQLVARLQQVEPDPDKTFCLEAGVDYAVVEEIWSQGIAVGSIPWCCMVQVLS